MQTIERKAWVYLGYLPQKTEQYKKYGERIGLVKSCELELFRMQIKEDSVYTCEKHFRPEDIETRK
jgi:hypothetical protein